MTAGSITNREGEAPFDVHWAWASGRLEPGVTAVIRARNEARNLPWVLPPLLSVVDRLVLVDNLSGDGTGDAALQVAREARAEAKLDVQPYPFEVSRCGEEHLHTPGDSVHSLTHFYNWAFSRARTRYTMKWDGDMVLTPEGVAVLTDALWQVESTDSVILLQHQPLYLESDRVGYLDTKLRFQEPWIYPTGPDFVYLKGFDWEVRTQSPHVERLALPAGLCFELKWLDSDEFDHWTSLEAFHPTRSPRKVREHEVFTALNAGRFDDLDHVHRIEAPPGVHVIDHVAHTWLPRAQPM
jgi:hypothetical protein